MRKQITLSYRGGPADKGELDAYVVADSMHAFSDLVGICAHTLELDRAHVRTFVSPPEKGSTLLQFTVEIGGAAATLLSGVSNPSDIFSLMGNVFNGFKLLEGKPPSNTRVEGSQVHITTESGNVVYMDRPVFNIVTDHHAGRAAGKVISNPISDGVDIVEIKSGIEDAIAEIDRTSAHCFTPMQTELPIIDYHQEMKLEVISPVFKDGKKWQFSDGEIQFWASIEDEKFLRDIDTGEEFRKGDKLHVDLRIVQFQRGQNLKTERSILDVIEHRKKAG